MGGTDEESAGHAIGLAVFAFAVAVGLFAEVEGGAAPSEYLPSATMSLVGLLHGGATFLEERGDAGDRLDPVGTLLESAAVLLAAGAGLWYLARGWATYVAAVHLLAGSLFLLGQLRRGGHWLRDVVELGALGVVLAASYGVLVEGLAAFWLLLALGGLFVVALEQVDRPVATEWES